VSCITRKLEEVTKILLCKDQKVAILWLQMFGERRNSGNFKDEKRRRRMNMIKHHYC